MFGQLTRTVTDAGGVWWIGRRAGVGIAMGERVPQTLRIPLAVFVSDDAVGIVGQRVLCWSVVVNGWHHSDLIDPVNGDALIGAVNVSGGVGDPQHVELAHAAFGEFSAHLR